MQGFTHESQHNESIEWYTPAFIFEALKMRFDMDPCYPPDRELPWIPVARRYTIADNGLIQPWYGEVWMNPPYGQDTPRWMERLCNHGQGIALVFSRTDTGWFHEFAAKADLICFVRKRIKFVRADGKLGGSPGTGSMLVAYGPVAAKHLIESNLGLCFTQTKGVAA